CREHRDRPAVQTARSEEAFRGEAADDDPEEGSDDHRVSRYQRDRPLAEPGGRGLIGLLRPELALLLQDPLGRHEPAWESKSRRFREPPERVVLDPPVPLDAATGNDRTGQVRDVPSDRCEDVVRLLEPAR